MSEPRPTARREPAFNLPGVVLACCLVLLGIHAARNLISTEADNRVVALFAFVPARLTLALHLMPARLSTAYNAIADRDPVVTAQINFLIGDGQARWWTLLTYAFLHGSWAHVGFNCVWLVAFGSAVARRFSSLRFMVLMTVSAVAGAMVQYFADMVSFQIVLGRIGGGVGRHGRGDALRLQAERRTGASLRSVRSERGVPSASPQPAANPDDKGGSGLCDLLVRDQSSVWLPTGAWRHRRGTDRLASAYRWIPCRSAAVPRA